MTYLRNKNSKVRQTISIYLSDIIPAVLESLFSVS